MLDYSEILTSLEKSDQVFIAHFGTDVPFQQWNLAMEQFVCEYNRINGTHFDPVEARQQYAATQVARLASIEVENNSMLR